MHQQTEPIGNLNKIIYYKMTCTIWIILFLFISAPSFSQQCNDYKNTLDPIKGIISIDNNLHSEFFDLYESSYPWYIVKNEDGSLESVLDSETPIENIAPIEHTANCISTHQGEHAMNYCDARYVSDMLELEVYGGLPAYASSLMIRTKGSEFYCYFKASYPALVSNCKRIILSKTLILKSAKIEKGKRIYAWISVVFKETSTYQGKTTSNQYKIEGYLKPVVN